MMEAHMNGTATEIDGNKRPASKTFLYVTLLTTICIIVILLTFCTMCCIKAKFDFCPKICKCRKRSQRSRNQQIYRIASLSNEDSKRRPLTDGVVEPEKLRKVGMGDTFIMAIKNTRFKSMSNQFIEERFDVKEEQGEAGSVLSISESNCEIYAEYGYGTQEAIMTRMKEYEKHKIIDNKDESFRNTIYAGEDNRIIKTVDPMQKSPAVAFYISENSRQSGKQTTLHIDTETSAAYPDWFTPPSMRYFPTQLCEAVPLSYPSNNESPTSSSCWERKRKFVDSSLKTTKEVSPQCATNPADDCQCMKDIGFVPLFPDLEEVQNGKGICKNRIKSSTGVPGFLKNEIPTITEHTTKKSKEMIKFSGEECQSVSDFVSSESSDKRSKVKNSLSVNFEKRRKTFESDKLRPCISTDKKVGSKAGRHPINYNETEMKNPAETQDLIKSKGILRPVRESIFEPDGSMDKEIESKIDKTSGQICFLHIHPKINSEPREVINPQLTMESSPKPDLNEECGQASESSKLPTAIVTPPQQRELYAGSFTMKNEERKFYVPHKSHDGKIDDSKLKPESNVNSPPSLPKRSNTFFIDTTSSFLRNQLNKKLFKVKRARSASPCRKQQSLSINTIASQRRSLPSSYKLTKLSPGRFRSKELWTEEKARSTLHGPSLALKGSPYSILAPFNVEDVHDYDHNRVDFLFPSNTPKSEESVECKNTKRAPKTKDRRPQVKNRRSLSSLVVFKSFSPTMPVAIDHRSKGRNQRSITSKNNVSKIPKTKTIQVSESPSATSKIATYTREDSKQGDKLVLLKQRNKRETPSPSREKQEAIKVNNSPSSNFSVLTPTQNKRSRKKSTKNSLRSSVTPKISFTSEKSAENILRSPTISKISQTHEKSPKNNLYSLTAPKIYQTYEKSSRNKLRSPLTPKKLQIYERSPKNKLRSPGLVTPKKAKQHGSPKVKKTVTTLTKNVFRHFPKTNQSKAYKPTDNIGSSPSSEHHQPVKIFTVTSSERRSAEHFQPYSISSEDTSGLETWTSPSPDISSMTFDDLRFISGSTTSTTTTNRTASISQTETLTYEVEDEFNTIKDMRQELFSPKARGWVKQVGRREICIPVYQPTTTPLPRVSYSSKIKQRLSQSTKLTPALDRFINRVYVRFKPGSTESNSRTVVLNTPKTSKSDDETITATNFSTDPCSCLESLSVTTSGRESFALLAYDDDLSNNETDTFVKKYIPTCSEDVKKSSLSDLIHKKRKDTNTSMKRDEKTNRGSINLQRNNSVYQDCEEDRATAGKTSERNNIDEEVTCSWKSLPANLNVRFDQP